MGLSGLGIYKLLPKTNCKKCNFPTCLAFALALAKKSAELSKCPYISEEARQALDSASQPPIKLITIGDGEEALLVGNETVLFRHEEKFHHPTGVGLILEDTADEKQRAEFIQFMSKLTFERVGQELHPDLIAVKNSSGNPQTFASCLKFVKENSKLGLVLMAENPESVAAGLQIVKDKKPLIFTADEQNYTKFAEMASEAKVPLVVSSCDLEKLSELVNKLKEAKVEDLVLHIKKDKFSEQLEAITQMRRLAIRKTYRPFGFPSLTVIEDGNSFLEVMTAGALMAKYASIILLKKATLGAVLSLLTLRQNIYSDPQKPLQVEPKIYSVGDPDEKSPLLITTNFSLTYYTVLSEVESSKISSYILSVDTEGMSVLTAWAAEKFTPESIVEAMKKSSVEELVNHKIVVIPGYVAVMSADLQEQSGWQILVGPREASGITPFLKNFNQ